MNNLFLHIPKLVSVSDLQRDYPSLLKNLHSSKKPLLILKKNNLEAVILLPDMYEELMEKVRAYEEQEALEAIQSYAKEKKEKKLKRMKNIKELFSNEN